MNRHHHGSIAILLLAFAASPAALADQALLPDMSTALQSRIDGTIAATLNGRADDRREAAAKHSTGRGTQRSTGAGSGRTDEPGWKPYHSAM